MIKVDSEKRIHISRGDAATLNITANGGEYEFQVGDVIRLRIYEKKKYNEPIVEVTKTVETAATSVELNLTKENTTIGEDINKPITYWYEISLNETTTIIGYDEDGAKELVVYPAEKGE